MDTSQEINLSWRSVRLRTTGGQGVHREVESEGFEEKYRAVIQGAVPTMNRSAKGEARSSLHYGGEGVLIHSPHQGVCGRHGTEDSCVTPGGLVRFSSGIEISDPISDREMGSDAERVVGQLHSTSSMTKVVRLSVSRAEAIGSSE
jgi:hypothetical protein